MPQTAEILQTGTGNKTVKLFANLNRSRTFREKNRAFAMEGSRLILDAAGSGVRLRALLWTEKAREQYAAKFDAGSLPQQTLLISDALAGEIADTETSQGIFAIGQMLAESAELPRSGSRCMLLHCVQDPSNLGAILRTAEALGTDGLYLYQCCDLYNPKTIRSSMGALFRIPLRKITDTEAFLSHCRSVSLPTCAAVVDRDAEKLGCFDFSRGAAVLIGNEGNGLPQAVSAACEKRLTIPMSPASNSLNAAMAAGLFLWEMAKS